MRTHGFIPTDDVIAISDRLDEIMSDVTLDKSIRSTAGRYSVSVVRAAVTGDLSQVDSAIRFLSEIEDGRYA